MKKNHEYYFSNFKKLISIPKLISIIIIILKKTKNAKIIDLFNPSKLNLLLSYLIRKLRLSCIKKQSKFIPLSKQSWKFHND